jgi:putative NIF3 family GTP cyclohydrolase 1 type 2
MPETAESISMTIQYRISRRSFLQASTLTALAASLSQARLNAQSSAVSARALVQQIQKQLGVAADYKTVRDTFKAGNPDTAVQGVASTFMATLDVLQRAKAAGLNFVISHEPTIWSDADTVSDVEQDPLYKHKMRFVESNGMIVWRIHDLWHAQHPEPMSDAEGKLLGWDQIMPGSHGYTRTYKLPPTPLKTIGAHLAAKLDSRSVRLVGDPNLVVQTIAHGSHALDGNIHGLENADAVLIGETRDWDSVEYVRDLIRSRQKKAMIVISHEASEEAGMELFFHWFQSHFSAIRIQFISTRDRLWIV